MELLECNSKGDFMKYALENDTRIKEIDSAIPLSYSKELRELGFVSSNLVTVYWKCGTIEILDIVSHSTILEINK
jgi:hypothetical protein